jgi:pimeloyl-ACP methyl ester carboxylesterase
MYPIYRALMEHYRLVVIDMLGFGGSSRVQEMPIEAFASVEAMDELTIDWFAKWVEQMDADDDLPPKFYLSGHSWGGYMTGLYASRYPERIAALFLNSPIGPEALPEDLDIYNLRFKNNEYEPNYAKAIDYWGGKWEQLETPL